MPTKPVAVLFKSLRKLAQSLIVSSHLHKSQARKDTHDNAPAPTTRQSSNTMGRFELLCAVLVSFSLPLATMTAALPNPHSTAAEAAPDAHGLDARAAPAMFTLGYAECQTTTYFGGQLVTGERKDLFVATGNVDVGCGHHADARLGVGTHFQDMSWFQHPVCGRTLNFAPKNGNFDVYEDGHYDLLGTCYPHSSKTAFCPKLLGGGTCAVETKFWCQWSGKNPRPCA